MGESILKKAQNLFDKISDEINKDKWDPSQVNVALLTLPVEENKPEIQISKDVPAADTKKADNKASNTGYKTSYGLVSKPEKITEDNKTSVHEINYTPLTANTITSAYLAMEEILTIPPLNIETGTISEEKKPVKDVNSDKNSVPDLNINKNITGNDDTVTDSVKEKEDIGKANTTPDLNRTGQTCYYTLIKHIKTYPEKGSLVMMRGCDRSYAWTDSEGEDKKPDYDICPVCGGSISHIQIEID